MAEYRLKIKIGDHEFDAEGPKEMVQAQFEAFKELISLAPAKDEKPRSENEKPSGNGSGVGQLNLDKIMRVDGRIVSLTVRAADVREAVLLIMLGQRQFRNVEQMTGAELLDGLRESGHTRLDRIDRPIQPLVEAGDVIAVGVHRSRTYRLTNTGVQRAREVAAGLISLVP
jgi:hypothetical protein